MGCKVKLTVAGNQIIYNSKLPKEQMTLDNITKELLSITNFETKDSKNEEGSIPSSLKEFLLNKPESSVRSALKKALEKGDIIVGNYTLSDLKNRFPGVSFDGVENELEDDEQIIFDRALYYDGVGLGGKLIIGKNKYFVINNEYSANKFVKYLKTKKFLREQKIDFSEISNSVRKALDYIKQKHNYKQDQTALQYFFNNSNEFLYDINDEIDIYTTLLDYINSLVGEYVRQDFGDQFINSLMHRAKYSNRVYNLSTTDVKKILKGFEIDIDSLSDDEVKELVEKEFDKRGHPIKLLKSRAGLLSFKDPYTTFDTLGLSNYDETELAVVAEKPDFDTYGYNIYQIKGNYYVSKQKVITRDSNAKKFITLENAKQYIQKQLGKSLREEFNRNLLYIPNEIGTIKYNSINNFSPAVNTVITGITNYDGFPIESKIEDVISEKYQGYLDKPISELIDDFKIPKGSINSYEDAIIFLIELSKNNSVKESLETIKSLEKKDFLVINKYGNTIQFRQITDSENEWKKGNTIETPIIVPLNNIANTINTKAGKEIIKIITFSDFDELPSEINKRASGFIYDGMIYINASVAKMSDLTHELGHLYLGMMKAFDKDLYAELIQTASNMQQIQKRKDEKRLLNEYKFLSDEDLTEEAFVDLFGEYVFYTNRDVTTPFKNKVQSTFEKALKEFKTSLIGAVTINDVFKNFSIAMKDSLFSGNGLEFSPELGQYRRATNYISNAIKNKDIEMKCE